MRRGKAALTVSAEQGVVAIKAEMPGGCSVFRLQPEMIDGLVLELVAAAEEARGQFITVEGE